MGQMPRWELTYDERGVSHVPSQVDALIAGVAASAVTDLVVVCHGWNTEPAVARRLHESLFDLMADAMPAARIPRTGGLGLIWPASRWPDEDASKGAGRSGGAAATTGSPDQAVPLEALVAIYPAERHRRALEELAHLLDRRPHAKEALVRFRDLMTLVADADDVSESPEDQGEVALLRDAPSLSFRRMATVAPRARRGGAAAEDDVFHRLWDGAREALRQVTYWQMKKRAGVVGRKGLGPLIVRLSRAAPGLGVHLIGHSFGARLTSYALSGLNPSMVGALSPVRSVVLLQGAFSHFAFSASLPHDTERSGALAGMARRVAGPVCVTHSVHDLAVGRMYPLASLAARQDAADAGSALYRWGAMGHDGAQAVNAVAYQLGAVGTAYPFVPGGFLNLDARSVIRSGGGAAGAHSDIFHPEIAWVTVTAGGLTGG